jgi:hypothetical protein
MTTRKLFAPSLLVLALNAPALHAEETTSNSVQPNILKGDWEMGGSVSVQTGFPDKASAFLFSLNAPTKYFVMDHLALGGVASFRYYRDTGYHYGNYGIGPGATYYFLVNGPWAYFASEDLEFSRNYGVFSDGTWSWSSATSVGAHYFFTPSVSFGPRLSFNHWGTIGDIATFKSNYMNLSFDFLIHL